MAGWPSGLRRQFKALVFGRGFESHFSHTFFVSGDYRSEGSTAYTVAVVCRDDAMSDEVHFVAPKKLFSANKDRIRCDQFIFHHFIT